METVWLKIHCFKRIENLNRSKYNIYFLFWDSKCIMVMLQNTTFWNYALPHILDRKSPIYKANKYKICHSCLQENITLQAWKRHYFPLILPTGSLPTVPGTSFNLVGALELITLPLRLPEAQNIGERYQIPLLILYKQLREKPQDFGNWPIIYIQANTHTVNLPGHVHICLQLVYFRRHKI